MQRSKARTLLRATLQTDVQFLESVRVYSEATQCELPRYENRLHFDLTKAECEVLDRIRLCGSCGTMLMSKLRNVKLMSCGVCKVTHYCNRECQKKDWKLAHKMICGTTSVMKNLETSQICVRILSIMSLSTTSEGVDPCHLVMGKPDVLASGFSFEKEDALGLHPNAFAMQMTVKPDDNRVCNHFRQKKEPNRILVPIWDTCTDSLAFVPVSFGFIMGGGAGSCSEADACVRKLFKDYSLCMKCVGHDKPCMASLRTFVSVCATDWEI